MGCCFSGCKKLVEIDAPKSELITKSVFENNETANSALLTIYSLMFNSSNASPYHIPFTTGISADELTNNSSFSTDLYVNSIDPINSLYPNGIWTSAYNFIYQANAVYEGCDKSGSLDPDVKKQIMAEALFIRAYWHFYLVNLYGDVPLVTSTDYIVNMSVSRTSISKIYDQIIADLLSAMNNLNENYVNANALTTSTERVRPNKSTAIALLARAYLYSRNYSAAEEQSTLLINNGDYAIEEVNDAFVNTSKEVIWQLKAPVNSYFNTPEGYYFIPTTTPATEGKPTISPQLLNAFENGDLRKENWIGKYTDNDAIPAVDYYYSYKYKVQMGSDLTEHSILFRLTEQYLIRAEARAFQNNLPGAIADVDVVRKRADLPLIALTNPAINQFDLLSAIMKERFTELFAEQGHRWFDLKRTGNVNAVMNAITPLKGGNAWNSDRQLWPIPESEILNNPHLKQNPGYN